jgi:predicted flap endonuclease-1-like 5' DNA nuclease
MSINMAELGDLPAAVADKLRAARITTPDRFLMAVAQPAARSALSSRLGIHADLLLALGNRADLARIRGLGKVYVDMLEAVHVLTMADLAKCDPDQLCDKLLAEAQRQRVQRVPPRKQMTDWVVQARKLGRGIYE